ncbi:hypothetical protein T11_3948 [Trichinella zimbabwensis]|uniref:Uncharacterized protein n=1 Tax=Trichinella zimbabwensis TaxID=268475 RepID=A0A0V1G9G9_9BILA|nr:hypothetical protein T11_3948 [Trichinella zimbabwensis]
MGLGDRDFNRYNRESRDIVITEIVITEFYCISRIYAQESILL